MHRFNPWRKHPLEVPKNHCIWKTSCSSLSFQREWLNECKCFFYAALLFKLELWRASTRTGLRIRYELSLVQNISGACRRRPQIAEVLHLKSFGAISRCYRTFKVCMNNLYFAWYCHLFFNSFIFLRCAKHEKVQQLQHYVYSSTVVQEAPVLHHWLFAKEFLKLKLHFNSKDY